MSLITILIVEDHPIMRFGIAAMISSQPDMKVVGQAAEAASAETLFLSLRPDVVIVDLRLPGESGVDLIRKLQDRSHNAAFLVLTTYEGDEDIFQAMQAGARGYLIKGMSQESLIQGIYAVHAGRRFLPQEIREKLSARNPHDALSEREKEVLGLLARGMSNKTIAATLGVTEGTIKTHVGVILACLGAEDRTQAVLVAIQRGLVHL
jgi:DNA-binding NarL/FixJ family response regulator